MDVKIGSQDAIETDLNKEVDRAMQHIDFEEPDLPQQVDMTVDQVADLIARIAGEIQQVVSLVRPKPSPAAPCDPPAANAVQDPGCVRAAKDLLHAQINALQKLAGQLE